MLAIGALAIITHYQPDFPITTKYVFWFEVSALLAFGLAWIVKGGFIFTDDDEMSTVEQVKVMVTKYGN